MNVQLIDVNGSDYKSQLHKNLNGFSLNYLSVKDLVCGEHSIKIQAGNHIEIKKLLKVNEDQNNLAIFLVYFTYLIF